MMSVIAEFRGARTVLLVTGDPLWYSAGVRVATEFSADKVRFHPNVSAFQLACARMQWSMQEVETITVHGRPVEHVIPWIAPRAKLVILTSNSESPFHVARLLSREDYGDSALTVLGKIGGPDETRVSGTARDFLEKENDWQIPDFHTLCVECAEAPGSHPIPRGPGLPDHVFDSDGVMTKREIREITVPALWPRRNARLWDIGTGCGSVAIEWLRSSPHSHAIGIDINNSRLELAARNAARLGTPNLQLVSGRAPDACRSLPAPDSIFVGGGLMEETVIEMLGRLMPSGILVANAVTAESESLLERLEREHGGQLLRISVSRIEPNSSPRFWRPRMPITQWRFQK